MGSVPVAQPSPPRRFRVSRLTVVLLLLGAAPALALVALFALPGGKEGSQLFDAGSADDFAPGSVTTFREQEFHLVALPVGFLALDMRDPHEKAMAEQGPVQSPCLIPWRPDFEFMGRKGWFRNPCHGETYGMLGQCVSGPCIRNLDRYPVAVKDGRAEVDLGRLILGRPQGQATPLSGQ